MRFFLITLLLATANFTAHAEPVATTVQAEVQALLTKLEHSGCEFNRNGSWYTALEAKNHLLRKLEFFAVKESGATTEELIELGASTSTFTNKPYLVRCGQKPPVESKDWLLQALAEIRAGTKPQADAKK